MSKVESTAVAVAAMSGNAMILGGRNFKTAKFVTRSVLRQMIDVPFYVKIESPIRQSTMDPDNSKFKDPKDGSGVLPDVCNVINLDTGEVQILICNAVMASELRQNYPDDGYVNKMFGIVQTKGEIDKRYKVYKIIELELDEGAPGGATATKTIDADTPEAVERAKHKGNKTA